VRKATVLLAEDHAIVAEGIRNLLEDEFELVGTVADGLALIKAAKQLRPDVIVADISIPLLNGLDAARQLKAKQVRSKIVFLTMHGSRCSPRRHFALGPPPTLSRGLLARN
jgi:DNA-binding NarL/FixJ family response regulator